MSSIVISGDTSGTITVTVPAVAGTNTVTIPAVTGNVVLDSATQTLTNKTITSPTITGAVVSSMASSVISSGTSVASTSGTSIDFTGIPSWVKRVTVMFNGVSTNGSSQIQIQIGSGSVSTSGYASGASYAGSAGQFTPSLVTTGLILEPTGGCGAAALRYGSGFIALIGSNTWAAQINTYGTGALCTSAAGGVSPALGGALDRIRITTVNGTDTFDAGSINILYE